MAPSIRGASSVCGNERASELEAGLLDAKHVRNAQALGSPCGRLAPGRTGWRCGVSLGWGIEQRSWSSPLKSSPCPTWPTGTHRDSATADVMEA